MEGIIINWNDLTEASKKHLDTLAYNEEVKEMKLNHNKYAYKFNISKWT